MKTYNKLVRDKIPEIIKADGKKPITRILSLDEFETILKRKLVEESSELLRARTKEDLIGELADVYEILDTILELEDIDRSDVRARQTEKKRQRGGFEKRIYLETVWD